MIPKNVRLTFLYGAAVVLATSLAISASARGVIDGSRNLPEKVQTTVPLGAVADATVRSDQPDTNFGSEDYLEVTYTSTEVVGVNRMAAVLIRFDLSSIPDEAIVDTAYLRLYMDNASGANPVTIAAYFVTSSWSESTVTWNSNPTTSLGINASIDATTGAYKSWYIPSFVQSWIDDPSNNHGLLLLGPLSGAYYQRWFESRDHMERVPQLEVTYHLTPYTFSGNVYQGELGDTSTPVGGVTVELWGDQDESPEAGFERVRLDSTTSSASGDFRLEWGRDTDWPYLHVIEVDPPGSYSTGAGVDPPGYVKNDNVVSYRPVELLETGLHDFGGIAFWDRPVPTETPTPTSLQVTLCAVEDAWVDQGIPTNNNGADVELSVGNGWGQNEPAISRALLYFDLSWLPPGSSITNATFKAGQSYAAGVAVVPMDLYAINDPWDEMHVTWDDQPTVASTYAVRTNVDLSTQTAFSWDVRGLVQGWVDGTRDNWGLELRGPEDGSLWRRAYESREGSYCPRLVLEVEPSEPFNTPTPVPTKTPTSTPIPCLGGDAGDTFDLASPLSPNAAPAMEYICPSGDTDFWRFDLEAGEKVELTLYNMPADYDLALLSPTGGVVASSERWGANRNEVIREVVYTPGTYRALVWGKGVADWSRTEPYSLAVETNWPCSDPDAVGDTFLNATAILPSLPDAGVERPYRDAICPGGDVDFYSFTVPGGHLIMMNISLSDLPADYDLKLYDPNGTLVGESNKAGTEDEVIVYGTSSRPGMWRAAVEGKTAGDYHSNDYTLEVKMVGSADLTVEGIEITQAIQDLENSIPLVAGKNTVARVYVGADNVAGTKPVTDVSVELRAYNPNHTLIPPVLTLDGGIASQLPVANDKRLDYAESLNFIVPKTWLAGSSLHLHAEVNPGPSAPESDYSNNTRQATIAISRTDPINLVFVPLSAAGLTPNLVGNADLNAMVAWLRNVYPNSWVRFGLYPTSLAADYDYQAGGDGCGDGWADLLDDLNDLFYLDLTLAPQLPVTYYYGLLDTGVPTGPGGCGRTPGHVAAGFVSADDGRILAHELTHNFGHYHAPSDWNTATPPTPVPPCENPGKADTDYPQYVDPAGVNYRRSSIGEVGLNLVAGTPAPQDPRTTYDFMSYCNPQQWISPYRYTGLLGQMHGARPNTSAVTAGPAETRDAAAKADEQSPHLFINGRVRDGRVVLPHPIWILPSSDLGDIPPDSGPYSLELQDAAGNVLLTRFFDPQDPFHSDSSDTGSFYEIVPFEPDTAQIVFLRGAEVVHTVKISPHAPVVRLLNPNGGEVWDQGKQTITWQATDADGDALAAHVRYSSDGGDSWQTLGVNVDGTKFEVDVSGLPGGQESLVQVVVSDGVNTTADASDAPFTVARRKPLVLLMVPPDGLHLLPEDALFMQGAAFDPEDGALAGDHLAWSSDRDGPLGTGDSLAVQSLSTGRHLLTLTATDSEGMQGTASVEVFVGYRLFAPMVLGR